MATNKVPTLVLGLGGIGCQIAQIISDKLTDDEKRYIGIMGLDTNIEDLKTLNIKYIQTSDSGTVQEYIEKHPEYEQWFPLNQFTAQRGMLTGAGQIRAISRLAALAAIENGKFVELDNEIRRILKKREDVNTDSFNLYLVGSITGGTGAGLFLQMPFYVRHILQSQFSIDTIRTRGMFISADLTIGVQPSNINKDAVKVNAYACMKELNAFYLPQNRPDSLNNLEMEYYVKKDYSAKKKKLRSAIIHERRRSKYGFDTTLKSNRKDINKSVDSMTEGNVNIPYDAFYLIEGTDKKGSDGNDYLITVIQLVGKMLYTMLFTPLKAKADGVGDNFVLHDMEKGGMNRYNSAGICCLKYPYEQALEYVTLRWIKELIKQEWLYLDMKYEAEKKAAYETSKRDSSIRIPVLRERYTELFDAEVKGGDKTKLAFLKKEVFFEKEINNPMNNGGSSVKVQKSRTMEILNAIDQEINKIESLPAMSSALNKCEFHNSSWNDDAGILDELDRLLKGLETLGQAIDDTIAKERFSIAEKIFPSNLEAFNQVKDDSDQCIYQYFKGVHPIAGRYMAYTMVNELEKKLSGLTKGTNDRIKKLKKNNYGNKKDGELEAYDAASTFIKKKIPVINVGGARLERFKKTFKSDYNDTKNGLLNDCKNSIKLSTYTELKTRFIALAEYYEQFFNNLENRIKVNDERLEILEKSFIENPLGENIVYGSPKAFDDIYNRFAVKAIFELPEAAKLAVAEGIFELTYSHLKQAYENTMTESQKIGKQHTIDERVKNLFDMGVVGEMKKLASKYGKGIIDLNIRQALEREYQLKDGYMDGEENYEFNRIEYAQQRVLGTIKISSPMLAVEPKSDISEIVYLAMNPVAAELNAGEPDAGITAKRLAPAGKETDEKKVCVLLDNEFSPYEMICMKTAHNYCIEELRKYREGRGSYAEAYNERIMNLDLEPIESGKDAYKTVVNPHLDRNWHEEAFVPPMGEEARLTSEEEVRKAFIYAMGWDSLIRKTLTTDKASEVRAKRRRRTGDKLDETKRTIWWYIHNYDPVEISKVGRLIGDSYTELFDALRYNGMIKRLILEDQKYNTEAIKDSLSRDNLVEKAIQSEFIQDLAQTAEHKTTVEEKANVEIPDENIIDIFIKMYDEMDEDEWKLLFEAFGDVLVEYFDTICNHNPDMIEEAYCEALEVIESNCSYDSKLQYLNDNPDATEEEKRRYKLTEAEERAMAQIDKLIDKEF